LFDAVGWLVVRTDQASAAEGGSQTRQVGVRPSVAGQAAAWDEADYKTKARDILSRIKIRARN